MVLVTNEQIADASSGDEGGCLFSAIELSIGGFLLQTTHHELVIGTETLDQ